MPSTSIFDDFAGRAVTARNVSIYTAILTGLPVAYAFRIATGYGPGSFLLLLAIAVGVPTALDQDSLRGDGYTSAVTRTVALGLGVLVLFAGTYLAGTALVSLPPFQVAAVAFLLAYLTPLAVLDGRA